MNAQISHNQGVALLTVIFLVALAALTLSSFNLSQRSALQAVNSSKDQSQAWSLLALLEQEAIEVLRQDISQSLIDDDTEAWSQHQFRLGGLLAEFKQAHVSAKISDEQAKINLNNLMFNGQLDPVSEQRVRRLLQSQQLADSLLDGIIDWLDSDALLISNNGAEDDFYRRLNSPYLAANTVLSDISELRLIRDFNAHNYALLRPYLTALPERTAVNINIAAPVVLASLDKNLSISSLDSFEPMQAAFNDVSEFIKQINVSQINTEGLATNSRYFLLQSEIGLADYSLMVDSLIYRESDQNIRIIKRAISHD